MSELAQPPKADAELGKPFGLCTETVASDSMAFGAVARVARPWIRSVSSI
jgi:hypothetical protein